MVKPMMNKEINAGTRLGAMILDHFIMSIIAMIFYIPAMIRIFTNAFDDEHEHKVDGFITTPWGYIAIFGFALYFCKDIINGRSIAKRILKLQVVDNTTGAVASPLKCFIRNILCILWPVEVIVALINTHRRLGDRVAGTKLVVYDPSLEQPAFNIGKALIPVALSYAMLLAFIQLMPTIGNTATVYKETSYNQPESKSIELLLADSLGKYFTPDVKVYDTLQNKNWKYISVVAKMKKDFTENENTYRELDAAINKLVDSKYPEGRFTGKLKYIYRVTGQYNVRTTSLGTEPPAKNVQ
jgi:uncharacterized RDD family membrane protein YckC